MVWLSLRCHWEGQAALYHARCVNGAEINVCPDKAETSQQMAGGDWRLTQKGGCAQHREGVGTRMNEPPHKAVSLPPHDK